MRPSFMKLGLISLLTITACSSGPENLGTTSEALTTVCGAKPTDPVQGRDVSIYQGNFDWQAQKNMGVDFGYARISDGLNSIDSQFANNWSKMKAAGILRGAYQFFEPGQDATAQANMMVSKVGGMLQSGDLPCMIDVETTGGQSPGTIASKVQTWLDVVEKGTGRKPIIYTGAYFWQDYVQSTNFGGYGLWIANYGATCPLVPNGWKSWIMWQYSDGNGSLDHDVFNGTLAQLQGLAQPPDVSPRGYLDSADCTAIKGWAQDEDTPKQSIDVHLYFDGPAGMGKGLATTADVNRMDLCNAIGSCNHGFSINPPRSLLDDKKHDVYAYGIDSQVSANNAQLKDSPKSFTCPAPDIGNRVRRWVTSQDSFASWKFNAFTDVAPYADVVLSAVPKGQDLAAMPAVVQADDGTPEVWVLDQLPKNGALTKLKRHVINPDSLAAWRFTVTKMKAADLGAIAQGPDWPAEPDLVQGSGPEIDLLDVSPDTPAPPPVQTGGGNNGPNGGSPSGDGQASDHGGCSTTGSSSGSALGILFALFAVTRRRNRPI